MKCKYLQLTWIFILLLSIAMVDGYGQDSTNIRGVELQDQDSLFQFRVSLLSLFENVSREFGVPADILKGIAFVESHWRQRTPNEQIYEIPPSYGVMGLRDNIYFGHSLLEAARLLHLDPNILKTDALQNIRGTAVLLANYADDDRKKGIEITEKLETWKSVVARYSGISYPEFSELYAYDVFNVLNKGYKTGGIQIDKLKIDLSIFSNKVRGVQKPEGKLNQPDYPGAHWVSAHDSNYAVSNRSTYDIDLIVIHTTECPYAYAIDYFQSYHPPPDVPSSAHYVVRSIDGEITQMVQQKDIAYHAGNWPYNQRSVGIECEGYADDPSYFTTQAYDSIANIVKYVCNKYTIPKERINIIGHNEVPDPNDPTQWGGIRHHYDPGGYWRWNHFIQLVSGQSITCKPLKVVNTVELNVRTRPSGTAPFLTKITQDQKFVSYSQTSDGWYLLFMPGQSTKHFDGWASGDYLSEAQSVTQIEVKNSWPLGLRVRTGTSSGDDIIDKISDGQRFVTTGITQTGYDGYTWYNFYLPQSSGHDTGWSSGNYLNVIDNPPIVNAFNVTPLSVTLGDSFTISYTVSDDIGLDRVELWDSLAGSPNWVCLDTTQISGTYQSGYFKHAPNSVGTYWYGVHVVDNIGQWSHEADPAERTVMPPASPTIAYDPTSFSFTATQGGANPSDQYLHIWNSGGGTLNWTVSDNQTWLSLSPTNGVNEGTVTVSVNIAFLDTGTHNAQITISAPGATNDPQSVPVTLYINPSGTSIIITVTPTSFNFGNVVIGQSADATIIIANDSGSTATLNGNIGSLSAPFSVIFGGGSFSLPPPLPGGWSTSTQVVRFTPTSLGSFFASLTITHNATNESSPTIVPFSGTGVEQPAGCQWEVVGTISLSGNQNLLHMAISNGKLYVGRSPNLLTVIDLSSNTPIADITFGSYTSCVPRHIAVSGNRAYVALSSLANGQLAVVNTDNDSVDTYIPVGPEPWGVATFGNRVYVSNSVQWVSGDSATGRVLVIDKGTNTILDTIYVGKCPNYIEVDPLTTRAYVTNWGIYQNSHTWSVSVINTATNMVVRTIPIPNGPPNGVAITNNHAYITKTIDEYPSAIEVINTTIDSIVQCISVGRSPIAAAILNQYIFVTNSQSNNVTIIDIASNTLIGTLNVGNWPYGIAVDPSSNKVYVGNHTDRTISILECAPTSVETSTELRPKEYALQQNYPNPFNPETVIEYILSKGCHVEMSIYNLVGQKVRTLFSEYQAAGNKKIIWDGKDNRGNELSSGIYFYQLKAGDFSQTKKMVFLR